MLKKGFKKEEIGFFGEEGLYKITDIIFIIDPLDGTSGFVGGTDRFSTSIGYMENGVLKAGIIHHPLKDISYYGEKGIPFSKSSTLGLD